MGRRRRRRPRILSSSCHPRQRYAEDGVVAAFPVAQKSVPLCLDDQHVARQGHVLDDTMSPRLGPGGRHLGGMSCSCYKRSQLGTRSTGGAVQRRTITVEEGHPMKVRHAAVGVVAAVLMTGSALVLAEATTPRKPIRAMTCRDFLLIEDAAKPEIVYWVATFGKSGEPQSTVVDVDDTDRIVPGGRRSLQAGAERVVLAEGESGRGIQKVATGNDVRSVRRATASAGPPPPSRLRAPSPAARSRSCAAAGCRCRCAGS